MKKKKKAYMKNRILWEKALRLVLNVSKMRKQFLEEEMFGLSPLMMRSCVTVAAFISEASENNHPKEQLRYLTVSQEALFECIHYLAIIDEEGYGNTVKLTIEAEQVSVLLESYIKALKK
jgi:four helix bundle protein